MRDDVTFFMTFPPGIITRDVLFQTPLLASCHVLRRCPMRKLPLSVFLLAPLAAFGIYACDQRGPTEPESTAADQHHGAVLAANYPDRNPFLGIWSMTSAVVGSEELFVGSGMQYTMFFRSDGTHSVSMVNDVDNIVCPTQTSCEWDGSYSYTGTTLTTIEPNHPDPDERGEDTSAYVFCGGRLIFMDSSGDDGIRLIFRRTGWGS